MGETVAVPGPLRNDSSGWVPREAVEPPNGVLLKLSSNSMALMNPAFRPSLYVYTCTQVTDDYCVRWAVHMLQDTQLERGLSSTTAKQLERF